MKTFVYLPLKRAANLNPFVCQPWNGYKVTKSMVTEAIKNNRLVKPGLNAKDHSGRIAWLVLNKDETPIQIDIGMGAGCWHPVCDGNHRLAAAFYRGDKKIKMHFSGSLELGELLFGVDCEHC